MFSLSSWTSWHMSPLADYNRMLGWNW